MITRWTQHLKDEKEIEEFKQGLLRASWIFDRLHEILDEEEKGLDISEASHKSYENPSWAYLQAHKNGYRQCLAVLKKLTTLDQKDYNDRKSISRG